MANNTKPLGVNSIWATSGNKVDPGGPKAAVGWVVELPPYQTQNWIDWKQDSFIAHVNQHGIAQWDAVTEYQGGISLSKGSNGVVYKCVATCTNIDPINPLNSAYWLQAFEAYGSVKIVSDALAAHLLNYNTLSGIGNVPAARISLSVWSRAEGDARYASKAGDPLVTFNVATATQNNHAVNLAQLNSKLTQATESVMGIAKIASLATVSAGVNNTDIVTAEKLSTLYLPKAGNLSGLSNVATARTNLGLGSMALENATAFLRLANNLSDVPNKPQARINLGLGTAATMSTGNFLQPGFNLGDLASIPSARNNLGLADTATMASSSFLKPGFNLGDVPDKPQARINLGLGSVVTLNTEGVLQPGFNLGDVPNKEVARNNLGLADTATMNSGNFLKVGFNLGDIINKLAARENIGLGTASTYNIDNFLQPGYNLGDVPNKQAARNNIGLGSIATRNAYGVVNDGDLDFSSSQDEFGWMIHPNGIIEQWGIVQLQGGGNQKNVYFPRPFAATCWNIQLTNFEDFQSEGNTVRVRSRDANGFVLYNGGGNTFTGYMWRAIGR